MKITVEVDGYEWPDGVHTDHWLRIRVKAVVKRYLSADTVEVTVEESPVDR